MPSVGETLLETMASETPETVPDTPVVETTQDSGADEAKPRRQRKPKAEAAPSPEAAPAQAEVVADTASAAPADATVVAEQPSWLKRVESDLGFQNVADETEVRDRLVDMAVQQREELQKAKDEYERQLREMQYRQTADAGQRQPEQQQVERKPWQPPVEYPAGAARYLEGVDENGSPKWKSDTPAPVRAQTEQFIAWRDDMRDMIWNRPDQFFDVLTQFNEEQAKKVIEPFYEQRTAEEKRVGFFESFAEENANWLYARDPASGQPAVGQLSRIGQLFDQRVAAHLERGYTPEEAVEYAQYDVQRQTQQSPWVQQAAPTPEQVRQENKQKTLRKPLNGAGSVAPRTGSFTEPESSRPQNGHLRAGELLRQAIAEGVA